MRVKHKVVVRIGKDTELKNRLIDLDDTLAEVTIDGYERATTGLINIAATVTESLSLGDIAAVKGIYLEVDQDAQIQLNAGGGLIQMVRANSATGSKAKFFLEADITAVDVTAPAGAALNGCYAVWGDVTP